MNTDLTILIPTFKRPILLERQLDYFNSLKIYDIKIHILDSSPNEFKSKYDRVINVFQKKFQIEYHLLDDMIYTKKLFYGLGLVNTPFVVITPDDDFLNIYSALNCVDELKNKKDYSNATGEAIRIENNSNRKYSTFYFKNEVSQTDDPIKRGWENCKKLSMAEITITVNNVWRTSDLFSVIRIISEHPYKKYTEFMLGFLSSYTGKTLLLPSLMYLKPQDINRDEFRKTSIPKFVESHNEVYSDPVFHEEIKKYLTSLYEIYKKKYETKDENFLKSIFLQQLFVSVFKLQFVDEIKIFPNRSNKNTNNFIFNFLRIFKYFKILKNFNRLFDLYKFFKLFGYKKTSEMINLDPDMKSNIFSLINNRSPFSKDFRVMLVFLEKYDDLI